MTSRKDRLTLSSLRLQWRCCTSGSPGDLDLSSQVRFFLEHYGHKEIEIISKFTTDFFY